MRRKKKTNIPKIIFVIFVLAIIFIGYYFWEDLSPFSKKTPTYFPTETITSLNIDPISFETRKRQDELEKFAYEIEYPYFNIEFLDKNIEAFISEKYQAFEDDVLHSEIVNGQKYSLAINFQPYLVSNEIVSVKFVVSNFLGGAHSIHQVFTKNYNLAQKTEVLLNNIFKKDGYLKHISAEAIVWLKNELKDDGNDTWIEKGAGPLNENFKNFNFSKDGKDIIFHFNHYQVAPYYKGIISFSIPISELNQFLK